MYEILNCIQSMSKRRITYINANDKDWTSHQFVLCFGAYGTIWLLVNANHLSNALDECIDWLAENAPGLLCDEQVAEAYNEAIAAGKTEEKAYNEALTDVTTGGNCGNHIMSWEWSIAAEDPTSAELVALARN